MVVICVCPECLHVEFGESVSCSECGGEVLRVYAGEDVQQLIKDIWREHGDKIAFLSTVTLATLKSALKLPLEVRDNEDRPLKKEKLVEILRKNLGG